MLGAIIGDIVGSVYEHRNIKTKVFPLFARGCRFTDDTVMTVACADAIMNGGTEDNFIDAYKKWGRMYPNVGYGYHFYQWIHSESRKPYNSFGNGSAMRVSPCGFAMDCGFYARTGIIPPKGWEKVTLSASVTHNHPEGIKGAQASAIAVFLARFYAEKHCSDYGTAWSIDELKTNMKQYIEDNFGYDLSHTLDEIRPSYGFDVTCQGSVPQAITAFLESNGFEDAIRNAISLGGDSDTIAAITGSIAEAAYGIPAEIKDKAVSYLDKPLLEALERWESFLREQHE